MTEKSKTTICHQESFLRWYTVKVEVWVIFDKSIKSQILDLDSK